MFGVCSQAKLATLGCAICVMFIIRDENFYKQRGQHAMTTRNCSFSYDRKINDEKKLFNDEKKRKKKQIFNSNTRGAQSQHVFFCSAIPSYCLNGRGISKPDQPQRISIAMPPPRFTRSRVTHSDAAYRVVSSCRGHSPFSSLESLNAE